MNDVPGYGAHGARPMVLARAVVRLSRPASLRAIGAGDAAGVMARGCEQATAAGAPCRIGIAGSGDAPEPQVGEAVRRSFVMRSRTDVGSGLDRLLAESKLT